MRDYQLNNMHLPSEDLFELKHLSQVKPNCCDERKNNNLRPLLKMSQIINQCLAPIQRGTMINFKKVSTFLSVIAGGALALTTSPAQAFNFTSGFSLGSCSGLAGPFYSGPYNQQISNFTTPSCTTGDGFTLTASGGPLQGKIVNNVTGVGITNGPNDPVPGEVNTGEELNLILPGTGGVLESLGLSFLYRPGVFSDKVYEVAAAVSDTNLTGTLRITSPTTALWNVAGLGIVDQIVNAVSGSNPNGGGWYNITNPFGNSSLSSLVLKPLPGSTTANPYNPTNEWLDSFENSDFSLVSAEVKSSSVPEPATIAGLALVGGLLAASRRRKVS